MPDPATAARRLRDWILSVPMTFTTEAELQNVLAARLDNEAGLGHPITSVLREERLDAHNRIDFLVHLDTTAVGVEVKIGSALAAVRRQLERYAAFDTVDELLLVTTKARHHQIPAEIGGKPVVLCSLIEVGL